MEERKTLFPKGFFSDDGLPEISTEDALKDVVPMKWVFHKKPTPNEVIVMSAKEKENFEKENSRFKS